jgi:hypothetical protein
VPLLYFGLSSCRLWPITSMVHNSPGSEFFWRCSSCAMPLLRGRTPSCRRQPTSSEIHNLLGSVPVALRTALHLDAAPMLLLHCSRRFHHGLFHRDLPMFHFGFHVSWI